MDQQALEVILSGNQFKRLYESEIASLREKYGLRKIDVEILYFLYISGEKNTSKDLKELHLFTKGHISQSVDRMKQAEFIEYRTDAEDRRRIHLLLTDKAIKVIGQISSIRQQMYETIFQGITPEEKEALLSVAAKIAKNMERALS